MLPEGALYSPCVNSNMLMLVHRAAPSDVLASCQVHQVELPDLEELLALHTALLDEDVYCEHSVEPVFLSYWRVVSTPRCVPWK